MFIMHVVIYIIYKYKLLQIITIVVIFVLYIIVYNFFLYSLFYIPALTDTMIEMHLNTNTKYKLTTSAPETRN